MAEFGMNPQMAVDAPRFYVEYDNKGEALQDLASRVYFGADRQNI